MTTICQNNTLLYGCKQRLSMLDKIIKMFFTKKKNKSELVLTVRRNNIVDNVKCINEQTLGKNHKQVDTCLSKYFINHKGLNPHNIFFFPHLHNICCIKPYLPL